MKKYFTSLLSILVLVCLNMCLAEDVITLTDDTFDDVVNNAETILVEFYAPWCGHCKHLAPEYEKAAGILKGATPPIPLAKVDATEEKALADRFGIRGYPTLYVFSNGEHSQYNGPRTADGIVSYMKKQAGPASRPLKSADEVNAFTSGNEDIVFVAFFDSEDAPALQTFRLVAKSLRNDFVFGEVVDAALSKELGRHNNIVAFKGFDEKITILEEEKEPVTPETLTRFVYTNSVPLAGQFSSEIGKRYKASGLPTLFIYFDIDFEKNVKRTNYYVRRLEKVAKDYQGKLLFTYADKSILEPGKMGDGNTEAVVGIENFSNGLVYKFTDTFSVDNLKKFVDEFLAGNLKPFIKSEPVPTDNNGPVTVVVGETFGSIVMDDSKDVLIEFYAPWCGHCKSLTPIYEELGSKFAGVDNVVIAKMDATANDWPKQLFTVTGFPTIYFKPAHSNGKVLSYSGERKVDSFVDFITKNAGNKLDTATLKDEL